MIDFCPYFNHFYKNLIGSPSQHPNATCFLTLASIIFRLRVASIFVTRVTRTAKPLQSDSQGSKITGVYSKWSKWPVERSHGVTSGQLPVLSDVENFVLKNFYCTKRFAVKFQRESLRRFLTSDPI